MSMFGKYGEAGVRIGKEKKEKTKSNKRAYKFTNKKHPPKAICGCILGCVSLVGILAVTWQSFRAGGDTRPAYGVTGLLAVIFSVTGGVLSGLSFRDRDSFTLFSWIGSVLCVVVLLIIGLLFAWGLNA